MQSNIIYQNELIFIEKEPSQIPWVKIFTQKEYKELADLPKELRSYLWDVYDVVEKQMQNYYNPTKINMASFGNMLPRVHIHVMARFENDNYFPEPMWGKQQRDTTLELADEKMFFELLRKKLEEI